MSKFHLSVLMVVGFTAFVQPASAADLPTFRPVENFPQLPANIELGPCSAVSLDSEGNIFLFNRGKHPLIALDKEGKYVRSWGEGDIHTSHGLRIDSDNNIWVTDVGSHRVLKYDREGKILLALGTGQPGEGDNQFDKPTDVAFGPKGEFYVSDGYGNSRVLKFSPSGGLITKWGSKGVKQGQFNLPHAVLVDAKERVLVGDRENSRIQVFDADGKFIEMWRGFAPYGITQSAEGELFVADGKADKILQLTDKGNVLQRYGAKGTAPGKFQMPHMLAVDADGNLLVAEVDGKRLQKLERKKSETRP